MPKGRMVTVLAMASAVILAVGLVVATEGHRRAAVVSSKLVTAAAPHHSRPAPSRKVRWPRRGWVAVAVANVWDNLHSARPLDAAMDGAKPNLTAWLAGLDYQGRLGLDDLLATQALLNDPLVVLSQSGGWAHVMVTRQTGAVWVHGIEGWMPSAQVTYAPPAQRPTTATVAVPTATIGGLPLSYGTQLPVLAASQRTITVAVPRGKATVPTRELRTRPLRASGTAVVAEAKRFLGLPYLWAGTSGFGFDCSGLTFAVYRQFGITLPRDAADQAAAGRPVDKNHLQAGDLVFYAFGGPIDHVGIYAGGGKMIDSPQTGNSVELVEMWGTPLSTHFAGAARYLPGTSRR